MYKARTQDYYYLAISYYYIKSRVYSVNQRKIKCQIKCAGQDQGQDVLIQQKKYLK